MGVADLLTGLLPRPTIDEHACSRRLGSGCSVCVDACPQTALKIDASGDRDDHAPVVDPLMCVGCGLCEAQCPVEAISGVAPSPQLLVDAARGGRRLRLRCEAARTSGALLENQPGTPGLDVGCLASLHPETVAAIGGVLAEGGAVELLHGDCERCPLGAAPAVDELVSAARACLAGAALIHQGRVADEGAAAESAQRPTARMSRRALFRKASPKRMAEDAVQARSSSSSGRTPRELLLESVTHPALPRPRIQPGCTACRACVQVCPQDALSFCESNDVFELSVDPTACVGCDECVRVCPENIVAPSRRTTDAGQPLLAVVELARCDLCAMLLSPGEVERCASCHSRRSLVSDVWSQYGL